MEPPTQKITNPTAVFSGLDKITGRIINFEVAINETVRFGALEVTPRVCYTRPPTLSPNTDGFIEVDELTLQGELRRIFTGWMFAASPGINAVEHPIYDVWLTDCKGATPAVTAEAPQEPTPAAQPRASATAAPAPAAAPGRTAAAAARYAAPATARHRAIGPELCFHSESIARRSASAPASTWPIGTAPKSASPTSAASSSL